MLIKFCNDALIFNFAFMKMEHYIAQLLYRYQCVTVPGFGAFLTEIQPAQLVETTNTFYPPKKVISFNSNLKNNDGLLANHIAQAEKFAYEMAVQHISKEVSLWKNALLNQQNIVLNSVGTLHLNNSGNLQFQASSQINFNTASFGLNTFVSPLVQREIIEKMPEALVNERIVLIPEPVSSSRNSYLKYAAVFILALTAAGSIGYKMYDTQVEEQTRLVQTEVQKDVQNKIQEATFFIENPLPNVTLTVKEEKNKAYHIVAGAFSSEANAAKQLKMLEAKGFKGKILERNKYGLVPVLYGSYSTYAESQEALKIIHKTESREAWLLIKD